MSLALVSAAVFVVVTQKLMATSPVTVSDKTLVDNLDDVRVKVVPLACAQVNPKVAKQLVVTMAYAVGEVP